MKLVTPSLSIEIDDGFKNDVLRRRPFGEALANLVINSSGELVISLNGKWGEGKTTFIKMWQGLLKEKGIPSIYVDAFQNDYTDDAFISVAGAITAYLDKQPIAEEKRQEFKDKAKKVGVRLLSWSAKVGIKAATLGAIKEADIEALSAIGDDFAEDTSNVMADLIKQRLASHSDENAIIQSFKNSLSSLPQEMGEGGNKRFVIIIDELDRCRPSFAVEMLEKIKHLFSVENVVFLMVMHKEQLEEAIKCVYGANIDAHTYLQKFINLEATLPKKIIDRYENDLDSYIKRLLTLHGINMWGDEQRLQDYLLSLAKYFSLSLRQLEKVFTNLALIYGTSAENQYRCLRV
jgi:predicted KAP-like P-loop ATPase